MRFTLLVLSPPDLGHSNAHALDFARTLVATGHEIACVFFYDAGALTGLASAEAPQDERDLRAAWSALAQQNDVPLVACIASAARFGLGEAPSPERLQEGFTIAGLGDLAEARSTSERLLTFGG